MKTLDKLLGIRYPIIQGGMANIVTGASAAAVCNAGALGLIATGGLDPDGLRREIADLRSRTDRPFGVNLMLMHPATEEFVKIVIEEKVPVVTTGAGDRVIPVVAAPILAVKLEKEGADAVIAEGSESGGHIGEMSTMALVPQVCDAVHIPVVAAGGIADPRQVRAAFDLGACGIQVGTCLLVSEECPIHENYKQALLKAKGTDAVVTGRIGGTPVRLLRNTVFEGDTRSGSMMAGQVVGQLTEIRPVADILAGLMEGIVE